jgi:hypothetical protein
MWRLGILEEPPEEDGVFLGAQPFLRRRMQQDAEGQEGIEPRLRSTVTDSCGDQPPEDERWVDCWNVLHSSSGTEQRQEGMHGGNVERPARGKLPVDLKTPWSLPG